METFKTKSGETISLQCFQLKEDVVKARLFDSSVIQASVRGEVVGYVKITYISQAKAAKLATPFDYFIYKIYGSDDKVVNAYESNDFRYLLEKLALKDLQIKKEDLDSLSQLEANELFKVFKKGINTTYNIQFKSMIDYWVDKPSIELIKVFSEKDHFYTDYSQLDYPCIDRENNTCWQGQRIGAALYESAAKWCHSKGLELWGSTTRTEDAKRMWNIMEKMPKFFVIMTEVCKYSSSGQVLSKTERPKLNIKELA
jgi:hypothetical protein